MMTDCCPLLFYSHKDWSHIRVRTWFSSHSGQRKVYVAAASLTMGVTLRQSRAECGQRQMLTCVRLHATCRPGAGVTSGRRRQTPARRQTGAGPPPAAVDGSAWPWLGLSPPRAQGFISGVCWIICSPVLSRGCSCDQAGHTAGPLVNNARAALLLLTARRGVFHRPAFCKGANATLEDAAASPTMKAGHQAYWKWGAIFT